MQVQSIGRAIHPATSNPPGRPPSGELSDESEFEIGDDEEEGGHDSQSQVVLPQAPGAGLDALVVQELLPGARQPHCFHAVIPQRRSVAELQTHKLIDLEGRQTVTGDAQVLQPRQPLHDAGQVHQQPWEDHHEDEADGHEEIGQRHHALVGRDGHGHGGGRVGGQGHGEREHAEGLHGALQPDQKVDDQAEGGRQDGAQNDELRQDLGQEVDGDSVVATEVLVHEEFPLCDEELCGRHRAETLVGGDEEQSPHPAHGHTGSEVTPGGTA